MKYKASIRYKIERKAKDLLIAFLQAIYGVRCGICDRAFECKYGALLFWEVYMQKIVVFDFDGVIHSYTSGWKGIENIPDLPVPGIAEAIKEIRNAGYYVSIVSSRALEMKGIEAIWAYLEKYNIKVDSVGCMKQPAICYIDDRAICFDGKPERLLGRIKSFKPWNK